MATRVAALEKQLRQAETVVTEYSVLLRTKDNEVVDIQKQLAEELAKRKDLQYALIRHERALLADSADMKEKKAIAEPKLNTDELHQAPWKRASTEGANQHAKLGAPATPRAHPKPAAPSIPVTPYQGRGREPAPIKMPSDVGRGEGFCAAAVSYRVAAWEAVARPSPRSPRSNVSLRSQSGPATRGASVQLGVRRAPASDGAKPAPAPSSGAKTPRVVPVRPPSVLLWASSAGNASARRGSAAQMPLRTGSAVQATPCDADEEAMLI